MKDFAKIEFYKCIQDSQELGSDNEHVISKIFFSFTFNEKTSHYCPNIHQSYGSNFSYESDPLQVTNPFPIGFLINYEQFRNSAESYYRMCVGEHGFGIRISGGTNIRMMNNTVLLSYSVSIEINGNSPAW